MNVGILGLGLIGGSLARAYAMEGHQVCAWDQDESVLSFAKLAGAVHETLDTQTIGSCQLILLAVYPGGSTAWLERHAACLTKQTLVVDCCGMKEEICRKGFSLARQYGFTFVGGHPMAGSQFSGFRYSRADPAGSLSRRQHRMVGTPCRLPDEANAGGGLLRHEGRNLP